MELIHKKEEAFNIINNFLKLNKQQKNQLEEYVNCLIEGNQHYNFIGKSTIDDIWNRHILDCAQLIKLIDNKNIKSADLGSGAGLPGIILSILGVKEIHLIEKSFRKSQFLQQTKAISPNKIFIQAKKLEDLENAKFDLITSRALAPLDKLLNFSHRLLDKGGYCLFLKGKNLKKEIELAKENFDFEYELFPSLTSQESNIIKVNFFSKLN
ncbi:MAG: 16S rRNA (guanine(527)-N(7))-methyltransferase RsmG [Rickettsiales bacterium]|nr:16S rRNA (guanine(527)-N(7))-methyltransferase RsmG [Rickettsiales bacterium]